MRMIATLLCLLATTALTVGRAAPVEACGHASLDAGPRSTVRPTPNQLEVPLNVVIIFPGQDIVGDEPLGLRVLGGAEVPVSLGVTDGVLRMTPESPLLPQTSYEVTYSRFGAGPADAEVISTFVTGTQTDDVAPPAPLLGAATYHVSDYLACEQPYCCTAQPGAGVQTLSLDTPPLDEPGALLLDVDGAYAGELAAGTHYAELMVFACNNANTGDNYFDLNFAGGAHQLRLTAYDLAGHASPSLEVTVSADCIEPPPAETGGDEGCAVAGGDGAVGGWLLVLLTLGRLRLRKE